MGSAMALPLHDRGWQVALVGTHLDGGIIENLRATGIHPRLKAPLPQAVSFHTHDQLQDVMAPSADLVVIGVASAGIDWVIDQICSSFPHAVPLLMITKGMHSDGSNLRPLPDIMSEQLAARRGFAAPVAAIGGPCIAGELAVRRNTGTVIVSRDGEFAERMCRELATGYYHPRPSTDMVGVEVCAAFKNFYAIGVGHARGVLDVMDEAANKASNHNAAAIAFDQALRELMVLTLALGGAAESAWGMPGAGDLYVTCQAGRNSRLGENLGRGLRYTEIRSGAMAGETVEGAELGLAVAPALRSMIAKGSVSAAALTLATALLDMLENDEPFVPHYDKMHLAG